MNINFSVDNHMGDIAKNRKERYFGGEISVVALVRKNEFEQPITVKFYATRARNYCCLWIRCKAVQVSGGGSAGGYGYHRASAAMDAAMRNAGIKPEYDISGRGRNAMLEAIKSMAKELGYMNFYILESLP